MAKKYKSQVDYYQRGFEDGYNGESPDTRGCYSKRQKKEYRNGWDEGCQRRLEEEAEEQWDEMSAGCPWKNDEDCCSAGSKPCKEENCAIAYLKAQGVI